MCALSVTIIYPNLVDSDIQLSGQILLVSIFITHSEQDVIVVFMALLNFIALCTLLLRVCRNIGKRILSFPLLLSFKNFSFSKACIPI